MTKPKLAAAALLAVLSNAYATDAPSNAAAEAIDVTVKALTEAQVRVWKKAVGFCEANQQPAGASVDRSFKAYIQAFSSGTKAGYLEIATSERDMRQSGPVFQDKDFEVMDKQADLMLKAMQASPVEGCLKLLTILNSGSHTSFKDDALQGHKDYKAKRAEYCSRSPRPKNCE